jgi:hypothetical protein
MVASSVGEEEKSRSNTEPAVLSLSHLGVHGGHCWTVVVTKRKRSWSWNRCCRHLCSSSRWGSDSIVASFQRRQSWGDETPFRMDEGFVVVSNPFNQTMTCQAIEIVERNEASLFKR